MGVEFSCPLGMGMRRLEIFKLFYNLKEEFPGQRHLKGHFGQRDWYENLLQRIEAICLVRAQVEKNRNIWIEMKSDLSKSVLHFVPVCFPLVLRAMAYFRKIVAAVFVSGKREAERVTETWGCEKGVVGNG